VIKVYYHSPCNDGFGAAWAAHEALGDEGVEYIEYIHGSTVAECEEGDEVFFLDVCPSPSVLAVLAGKCKQVTVIDHHYHVQPWVPQILALDVELVYDIEYSGCVLAWGYFNSDKDVPQLLKHVQDRDLWKWEIEGTQEVILGLGLRPKDFEAWSEVCDELFDLRADGSVVKRHVEMQVEEYCKSAALRVFDGHMVPVCNVTRYVSEVGARLLEMYTDAPFSITYADDGQGVRHYSLRSRGDFDVSKVAVKYGGGGHKGAAGFERLLGVL
jgi:oligoribonuclease NrnB/cAMP/cGMP phosphodiesterase (DHH superfamily)